MEIYIIENNINQKKYIGQSIQLNRRLMEHKSAKDSTVFHYAIKKHGWSSFFVRNQITVNSIEEMNELEIFLIQELNTLTPNGYNMTLGGDGYARNGLSSWNKGLTNHLSKETLQKMSDAKKGVEPPNKNIIGVFYHSEETKKKIREASLNINQETKDKISKKITGLKRSKETREKMSKAKQRMTQETKDKISKTLKGHIVSEETKAKISMTKINKILKEFCNE